MAELKSATVKIFIYDGTENSYTDADLRYTLQKDIITGQTKIVFEIAELVRDYIDVSFNDDYLSATKWVRVSTTLTDDTDQVFTYGSPVTNTYIATDGYGYFEEAINPQNSEHCLITSDDIYLPEDVAGKIPVFASGVGKVRIDSSDTQITDNGNSNQKIQYVTIPANSSEIKIYDTDDTTLLKTITVNNICEPKFTSYKVTFVNKHGAYQDLYFFKKTVESFSVTDETYKSNIIDSDTIAYNTNSAQQTRYNVNAVSSIKLNTGFVKESMNTTIEELFLTENAWIRYEGKTLPITPKSKNLELKTSLNDKLINYTIDFEFAFNKLNNVR